MNAIQLLKQDHRKVEDLLSDLEWNRWVLAAQPPARARDAVDGVLGKVGLWRALLAVEPDHEGSTGKSSSAPGTELSNSSSELADLQARAAELALGTTPEALRNN